MQEYGYIDFQTEKDAKKEGIELARSSKHQV